MSDAMLRQERFSRPPRVLVVEDHLDTADLLVLLLQTEGFEVLAVHDGAVAIDAARAYRPTVVLSDLDLPGRDGFSLAEQLSHDPEFRHTPMVAVTARVDRHVQSRAQRAGFVRFVPKPVEPVDLLRTLRGVLDRRGAAAGAFGGHERRS